MGCIDSAVVESQETPQMPQDQISSILTDALTQFLKRNQEMYASFPGEYSTYLRQKNDKKNKDLKDQMLYLDSLKIKRDEIMMKLKATPDDINLYLQLGKIQEEAKNPVQEIQAYEKVLELNKQNKEASLLLTKAYNRNQDKQKRYQVIMQCWRDYPKDKQVILEFSRACFEKGLKQKAIQLLNKTIRQSPEDVEAFMVKADFQKKMKKNPLDTYKAAISKGHITQQICLGIKQYESKKDLQREFYQKLLDKSPSSALAHALIGDLEDRLKNKDKAIASYEDSLKLDPYCQLSLENYGSILFENKQKEKLKNLIPSLKENIQKISSSKFLGFLAKIYDEEKKNDMTLMIYDRQLQINPNQPSLYVEFYKFFKSVQKNPQIASTYIAQAIQYDPKNFLHYYQMGITQKELNNPTQTVNNLKQANTLSPKNYDVSYELAEYYFQEKAYKEAQNFYKICTSLDYYDNKKNRTYYKLSLSYYRQDNFNEAYSALRRQNALNQKVYEVQLYSAELNMKLKKYSQAFSNAKICVEVKPEELKPYEILGESSLNLLKYSDALSYLKKALFEFPRQTSINFMVGRCFFEESGKDTINQEKLMLAEEHFNLALKNKPDHCLSLTFLALCKSKEKKLDECQQLLIRAKGCPELTFHPFYYHGEIQYKDKKYQEAIKDLQEAIKYPEMIEQNLQYSRLQMAQVYLCYSYYYQEKYQESIKYGKKNIEMSKYHCDNEIRYICKSYMKLDDEKNTEKYFLQNLKKQKEKSADFIEIIDFFTIKKNKVKEKQYLYKYLMERNHTGTKENYTVLAEFYIESKDIEMAIKIFTQMFSKQKGLPKIEAGEKKIQLYGLDNNLEQMVKTKKQIEDYFNSNKSHFSADELKIAQQKVNKLKMMTESINLGEKTFEEFFQIGSILFNLSHEPFSEEKLKEHEIIKEYAIRSTYQEAFYCLSCFKQCLKKNPQHLETLEKMAKVCLLLKPTKNQEGLEAVNKYLAISQDNASIFYCKSIYVSSKYDKQACRQKGLKLDPEHFQMNWQYAIDTSTYSQQVPYLEICLKKQPDNQKVKKRLIQSRKSAIDKFSGSIESSVDNFSKPQDAQKWIQQRLKLVNGALSDQPGLSSMVFNKISLQSESRKIDFKQVLQSIKKYIGNASKEDFSAKMKSLSNRLEKKKRIEDEKMLLKIVCEFIVEKYKDSEISKIETLELTFKYGNYCYNQKKYEECRKFWEFSSNKLINTNYIRFHLYYARILCHFDQFVQARKIFKKIHEMFKQSNSSHQAIKKDLELFENDADEWEYKKNINKSEDNETKMQFSSFQSNLKNLFDSENTRSELDEQLCQLLIKIKEDQSSLEKIEEIGKKTLKLFGKDSQYFSIIIICYLGYFLNEKKQKHKKMTEIQNNLMKKINQMCQYFPPSGKNDNPIQISIKEKSVKESDQVNLFDVKFFNDFTILKKNIDVVAKRATEELPKLEQLVKNPCLSNKGFHLKTGVKIPPQNSKSYFKVLIRVFEKMFREVGTKKEEIIDKIEKAAGVKKNYSIITLIDIVFESYIQVINQILQDKFQKKQPIECFLTDLVRGKCLFKEIGDLEKAAKSLIASCESKKYTIQEIDNRLNKITRDLVFKIQINQIVAQFQLALEFDQINNQFAHSLYEIQRSPVGCIFGSLLWLAKLDRISCIDQVRVIKDRYFTVEDEKDPRYPEKMACEYFINIFRKLNTG